MLLLFRFDTYVTCYDVLHQHIVTYYEVLHQHIVTCYDVLPHVTVSYAVELSSIGRESWMPPHPRGEGMPAAFVGAFYP